MFESVEPKITPSADSAVPALTSKKVEPTGVTRAPMPVPSVNKTSIPSAPAVGLDGFSSFANKFNNNFRVIAIAVMFFLILVVAGFGIWQYYNTIAPLKMKIADQNKTLSNGRSILEQVKRKVNNQTSFESNAKPSLSDRSSLIAVLDSIAANNKLSFSLLTENAKGTTNEKQIKFIVSGADLLSLTAFNSAVEKELSGVSIESINYEPLTGDYTFVANINAE